MEVEDADIPKGGKKCATNKVENGNIYIPTILLKK
jgi:hypothetical protein